MKGYLKKTIKWYLKILKLSFVFKGRTRRSEYWLFHLLHIPTIIFLLIIFLIILQKILHIDYDIISILMLVFYFIPSLAIAVRRLHDIGMSGAWILIILIPYIGAIFLSILLFFIDSQPGTNRWGKNPKGIKALLYDNDVEQK